MYDMNFFSVYKKRRAKSKGLKIFLAVFIVVLLLVNAGIIGGGLWLFNNMEEEIQEKEDWINDPATKEAIAEAARVREKEGITSEYLELLNDITYRFNRINVIDTQLLNEIRQLTPPDTLFNSIDYSGINVSINCISDIITDPMDMYHAFLDSHRFVSVSLSGINVQYTDEGETYSFSLTFQVLEEDDS